MKCLVLIFTLICMSHQHNEFGLESQDDKNVHNRVVCENEKLVLNCKQDQVIKISRAYYGRYSVTPCNKNHTKFTKGCVAADSMEIIQKLCENKSSCSNKITTNLFREDPCPGIDKVLEVNYNCDYLKKGKSLVESLTTNEITTSSRKTTNRKVTCYHRFMYGKNMYEIRLVPGKLVSFECSFQNDYFKNIDPELVTGKHLYRCESDGNLYKINSTCQVKSYKTNWLDGLNEELSYDKNSLKILYKLNQGLNEDKKYGPESLKKLVDLLHNATKTISETSSENENISVLLLETVDSIISKSDNWNKLEEIERTKSITKLIDLFDETLFKSEKLSISSDNIVAEISENRDFRHEIEFPLERYLQSKTDERVFLNIENPDENQKFLFVIYKNVNEIFPAKLTTDKHYPVNRFINSNILSFKINDKNLVNELKNNPIRLLFKHLVTQNDQDEFMFKPVCSYWKYDQNEFEGDWATDGCELEFTNQTHSICKCNHLTHFSILMDIYGVHQTQPNHHKLILSILTIVLSIISCICIIFTLLAFRFIKIIRRNRKTSSTKDLTIITTHLCICLLLSLMLFLIGILSQQLKLKKICSIIAILSHYTFLCSFFWMLLEGVQLYLMLVRIFILEKSPVNKFCLIAYLVPLLIVTISKSIDYYFLNSNGYGADEHCWISNYQNFNLSFILPITCILIANFIILTVVFFSMKNSMGLKQSRVHSNKKEDDFFKSLLSFWCLISTLLGLPWILGFFIIDNQKTLIFSYLFTIINSSQGTIIFIFNCLVSKSVRDELLKLLRKQKNRLFASWIGQESLTSSSTSSNYTSNNLKQSNIRNGDKNFGQKILYDCCLNSCLCSYPSNESYSSDQCSKKQTSNYLITPQYSSAVKHLQDLDENQPLNQIEPQIYLNQIAYQKHNIRMLSSLPYMKRNSSILSSSTLNSNNPTQSTYISPIILINSSIPKSPPPPPPQQGFTTFKPMRRLGNYDENQYLTPEYHNYSAVDTDFNTDTQYYMDNGLPGDDEDELYNTNNYDELLDHDLVYLRYNKEQLKKGNYLKVLKNLPSSSIGSTSSSSTSSSLTNEHSQIKLLSNTENTKAKKILKRPLQ